MDNQKTIQIRLQGGLRSKCSELMMLPKEVEELRYKQFDSAPKAETFAWSAIVLPGNGVKLV